MKSILDELFYSALENVTLPQNTEYAQKSERAYKALHATCTDEQKRLLLSFDDIKNERYNEQEKFFYVLGFQQGVKLLLEIYQKIF